MPASDMAASDQAAGLRSLARPSPVRVICVASGKGGVGKTNTSINLAVAMAQARKRVLLLDADLGLANIDVLLGLHPVWNLSHVLAGERTLEEILLTGPHDVRIVPASSGVKRMAELSPAEHAGVISAFSELSDAFDVLLVDCAAGISDSVITFARASQEIIVVVCNEPASLTDAYALIKLLSRDFGVDRFHVLANRVAGHREGRELFEKLLKVTDRFLDVTLDYFGGVPEDPQLKRAVQMQQSVVEAFPGSRAAVAFQRLAETIERWPLPAGPSGHLQFFLERLLGSGER
ncbi:MinD/ParA family protein [Plasticicumulans acidivorans]|uniref:Flagellar biosynthesis protein FlhG n=1 Tax=Plasticicumulans acidivorans TaxID=886464 RepID=A0A317MWJ1_9GAMM|nr:MinD/ParA family protein [Plasticicumulans acidivorans]PWV63266.1 flagellar biosynthesis protein FlhG [Plasticicumulans acidivorans]